MAAIDNLKGAVVVLTASVDRAVEKINTGGGGNDVDVQAAADQVAAEAARLDAAGPSPTAFRR